MSRAWRPVPVILASVLVLCGCAGSSRDAELRVGLLVPLSGSFRSLGTSVVEGAALAVEQANRDGGLLVGNRRHRVVLLERDTLASPEEAMRAAAELINQSKVAALIGPPASRTAIPVGRAADRAWVPLITPIATNPAVTEGTRCVFRVCFTDSFQGEVLARFARETLEAERAAVLFDVSNEYNRDMASMFARLFEDLGGAVVAEEEYVTGETDFRPHIRRIAASRPDVLFLPNFVRDVVTQLEQIRAAGLQAQVLGSDTMSFRNEEDVRALEGVYFSTHFSAGAPEEAVSRFSDEYRERFGREPTIAGALTYDAFQLLYRVVTEEMSMETGAICCGLRRVDRFEGVTGAMIFDGSPDPEKSAVIMHVRDGAFQFHSRVEPR